jgi:F0F1-type ATP synthase assembly protein I
MRTGRPRRGGEASGSGEEVTDPKPSTNEAPGAERQSVDAMRAYGTLGSVGLAFVLAIVIGAGGGLLIDRWVGSGHWGFFAGFFLGVAAGIVSVVRASKSIK